MVICIGGVRLDTSKSRKSWSLDFHDGNNLYTGHLYLSSRGTWYVFTPSQWGNGHHWERLNSVQDAIEKYGRGLSSEDIKDILAHAKLETE